MQDKLIITSDVMYWHDIGWLDTFDDNWWDARQRGYKYGVSKESERVHFPSAFKSSSLA